MIDIVSNTIDKIDIVFEDTLLYSYNLNIFEQWKNLVELITKLDFVLHCEGDCVQTVDMPIIKQRLEFFVITKRDSELSITLYSRHVADPQNHIAYSKSITMDLSKYKDIEQDVMELKKALIPAIYNKEEKNNE